MNIPAVINSLPSLSTAELAAEYEGLFGRRPRSRSPAWMRKRIAHRLQENVYGGLSGLARDEVERLAAEFELLDAPTRANVGRDNAKKPKGQPRPGTTLQREWHGTQIRVLVTTDGFEWNGDIYTSMSAVARAITGSRWNGRLFFGLTTRSKS